MIDDLETLNYLHDATVIDIRFLIAKDGRRTIVIRCVCHDDAEFEPWNGKPLNVLLDKVVLLDQRLYGHTSNSEEISGWEFSLPAGLEQEAERLQKLGIDCSGSRFDLAFQSGSYLRGICRDIEVVVRSGCE